MPKEAKHLTALGLAGILFVYLLQGSNSVMGPAVNAIAEALKIPPGTAAQVGTFGALFSVLAGLIAAQFAGRAIKYKPFLIVSLLVAIVGGTCPALFPHWPIILFSRACVGFAVGIYFAVPPALIMKFYQGEEQRKKLGLANVFGSFGGLLMMWTVGPLADLQWNSVFWIYFIGIVPLILIIIGLKEPEADAPPVQAAGGKPKIKLPAPVILNFVMLFMAGIFGLGGLLFISVIVEGRGFGTAIHASTVAIMFNVAATGLSFLFARLYGIFKKYLAIVILAVVNIGIALIYYANSLVMAGIGMACTGAFLLMMPTLLTDNAQYLEPSSMTFAASFLGAVMNLGNFVLGYYIMAAVSMGMNVFPKMASLPWNIDHHITLSPVFFGIFGLAATAVIFLVIRIFQKPPARG